ncbi:MAG: hypothetical protein NTY74_03715 [Ignavibacteriae bacterium]|nr:hypothetical protein [Ignavibacteriota bacterium]
MKIAGAVIGIVAGVLGLIGGFATVFLGEIGKSLETDGASTVSNLGVAAFWVSFVIIIVSIIIFKAPRIPSILLIILAILATIFSNYFSGPLALLGGIFGLIASFRNNNIKKTELNNISN